MATILGPRALIDNALPTGVDGAYLSQFAMQEGMTAQEVITAAAIAIGEANEYLAATYGGLFTLTERLFARHRQGTGARGMTPLSAEFQDPSGEVTTRVGHMLFIRDYKDAVAWSPEYLARAIREDVQDDIQLKRDNWINRVEHDIFTCMFRSTEVAVGDAGNGWSIPWAIGTGMNVNYIPPQWRSNNFDSTHTHFIRVNAAATSANAVSTIVDMAKQLGHHGHLGRKVAFVGEAMGDLILASTDKKVAVYIPAEFRLTAGNSNAPISSIAGQLEGVPGEIIALVTTNHGLVEVRRHDRVPAGYLWMGKSYGTQNTQNPMAIRLYPGKPFGLGVMPKRTDDFVVKLKSVVFDGTHGVNVNDPTAGVAAQIASGGATYEEPTIS